MRDFAIQLTHRPGEIARVAHALARKDVNLRSIAAMSFHSQGLMHVIADDVEAARSALREGSIPFEESDVVTVLLENKAGELEDVADKLSKAGVNLLATFVLGLDGDLVELALIADDPKKAKKAVE